MDEIANLKAELTEAEEIIAEWMQHWRDAQAKINALEKQIDVLCARELVDIRNENVTLRLSLERQNKLVSRYSEALKFYSDVENYKGKFRASSEWVSSMDIDRGDNARAALGEK